MYEEIVGFCQSIKKLAFNFKTFDEFYTHCKAMKNVPLRQSDFNRLISVASVEANLI